MTPWAHAWQVMVADRMVAVIPDLEAAVKVANDLGGALVPWRPVREGQQAIEGRAA